MPARIIFCVVWIALTAQLANPENLGNKNAVLDLRTRVEASPLLSYKGIHFAAHPTAVDWKSGTISWMAMGTEGKIYELQRGGTAGPILVLNREGKVLHSWGERNDYQIPHAIRIDPSGNVWTVDAGSSTVIKYSPLGKKLMTLIVGEQPNNGSPFRGTTDIAFGPRGHLFVTDGYGNARVLEYSPDGKRLKEWGKFGTGPGESICPMQFR